MPLGPDQCLNYRFFVENENAPACVAKGHCLYRSWKTYRGHFGETYTVDV